ncbi:MAG: hypothetical protein K2M36_05425, partial [Clostridia bacterium]|nr:hypothetical protein [Clostridia bacterium]
LMETFLSDMMTENDLASFKKYVDEKFDSKLASVKYNYGTTFNAYAWNPSNDGLDESEQEYMKVNPYSEMMYTVFDEMLANPNIPSSIKDMKIPIFGQEMSLTDCLDFMGNNIGEPWSEMSDNQDLLNNQYELVGKASRWPSKANEVVIVVSEDNKLLDYQLFMLGLRSTDDVIKALLGGDSFVKDGVFSVDELLQKEFKILTNSDYLEENTALSTGEEKYWTMHDRKDLSVAYVNQKAMRFADGTDTVKVVGVVRPKVGVVASSINGVIGYTSALTQAMLEHSANHPAVQAMQALYEEQFGGGSYYYSVISFYDAKGVKIVEIGDEVEVDEENGYDGHSAIMRQLGFVNKDYPESIEFYCTSFEAKEDIINFIAQYEKETGSAIKYTDSLSTMMSFVNTMATTITGVLVAFAAISLIVSTIMIAIIIYTSVL